MALYEFLFPDARVRRLEAEVERLRANADTESAATIRERLRKQWEEKQNPAPRINLHEKLAALEGQLATMDLVIEALLEELETRGGISREALAKRMHEIDARDGKVDGRKG